MAYSDWQIKKIRNALRGFHAFELQSDGSAYSWNGVDEAILEYTDVKIGKDRCRQFVCGVKKKDKTVHFPVPPKNRLDAIVSFLTDEGVGALSAKELEEPKWGSPLPLIRLLDYLDSDLDEERMPPPEMLPGNYEALIDDTEDTRGIIQKLNIAKPVEGGAFALTLSEIFVAADAQQLKTKPLRRRVEKHRDAHWHSYGWGCVTPEDTLFAFLKRDRNSENRYYMLTALDDSFRAGNRVERLVLLEQDYPAGPFAADIDTQELLSGTTQTLGDKVRLFRRVADSGGTA